ncbi:hypothetical protein AMATHDRAFT_149081 [Amanita thiersii Skay4041]|uniref:G-protein coupled receptors family 1 profile domain-containing protein n=1 Tax=Amanita thiersii Skay4041 TaxID=703135 RepID=A0A2A9NKF5_9AGAR|nr:hypothetical protein AMATHDRAFT_149081 [Amanita thiersii Skay4041]
MSTAAPASLTSDDLHQLGFNLIIKVTRLAFEATFYGVYLVLITASTTILCRKRLQAPRTVFLLGITLIMFLGSSLFFAIDITDLIIRLKTIFLADNSDLNGIKDRIAEADDRLKSLVWTGEILFVFMLILGDSVVIWRTWALYWGNRMVLLVPALFWLGSVAAAFYELGCDIKTGWAILDSDPSAGSVGRASCANADLSSFTLSYATNVFCTGLIFWKTWQFRQSMKRFLGSARRMTQAERILVLLIESGFLYLAIYTLQAVPIYGGSSPGSLIAWEVVNAVIQQAFGMYPTAIVVLVEMQRSLYDTDEVTGKMSELMFARSGKGSAGTETTMNGTGTGTMVTGSDTMDVGMGSGVGSEAGIRGRDGFVRYVDVDVDGEGDGDKEEKGGEERHGVYGLV